MFFITLYGFRICWKTDFLLLFPQYGNDDVSSLSIQVGGVYLMSLKFQKVFSEIQSNILNGIWVYGERIPSEMELCDMYGVSRITIRRALDKLVRQGVLVRTRGRGSYVCSRRLVAGTSHEWFQRNLEALGNPSFTRKLIHKERILATGHLAKALWLDRLDSPQYVWYFKSVGYLDDQPIGVSNSYVLEPIGEDMAKSDELDIYFYQDIEKCTGKMYTLSRGAVSAVNANEELCDLLKIPAGTPCLWSRSVGCMDDGSPVEVRYTIYNGNMFEFAYDVDSQRPTEKFWDSYR